MATNRIDRLAAKAVRQTNGDATKALEILVADRERTMREAGIDEATAAYYSGSATDMFVLREAIRRAGAEWVKLTSKAAAS